MGRLFGTDGVRGIAGESLSAELAMRLGRAAAEVLGDGRRVRFLVGMDPRTSSEMLCAALCAGLCAGGADVVRLGVLPTPAVAYLVKKQKADAGVMISASHNPAAFNGVKIFDGEGYKIADALEERIEELVLNEMPMPPARSGEAIGRITDGVEAACDYVTHLKKACPVSFSGLSVAIDCANGAASYLAEPLFSSLGAQVHLLSAAPDGNNINQNCGSTHLESLASYVTTHGLAMGIAFDGDADRCLLVDECGNTVNGDHLMAMLALDAKERGALAGNAVVGTVMSNMGFVKFCEANGIQFISTNVGDRYVLEKMLLDGYNFGGEQSGHLIFRDFATTGDGALTAIRVLSLCVRRRLPLSVLAACFADYSQRLCGVSVSPEGKLAFYTDHGVKTAIEEAKAELGREGRVLVRPSGTEPLIRVMAEGRDAMQIEAIVRRLSDFLQERLGAL